MNRRAITYVLLCTSLVVLVAAQLSFKRPALWRWAQAEPKVLPVSTEAVPRKIEEVRTTRRAPYPDLKLIADAADLEPFLSPAPDAPPELQGTAKAMLDAEARYHLLQIAKDALPGALEANGQRNYRYQALAQKPGAYRGELVTIQGDLISLAEPMELQKKVPGMEVCYVGLMTNEQADHQYLILFVDLPPSLTSNQKEWKQLYLRNVQFTGYFYKVAKFTRSEGKVRSWMLPVLVGKSLLLPELVAEPADWFNLITIFLFMAVPVVLIVLLLPRYFRKTDTAHESLMQGYRQRREERVKQMLDELPTASSGTVQDSQ